MSAERTSTRLWPHTPKGVSPFFTLHLIPMQTSQLTMIPLRRLKVLPNNPRTITQAKLNQLCDSIRENGFYAHKALAVEPIEGTDDYYILDGNQRKKALARMKRREAPCIIYTDLTEEERAKIILQGNINLGEWDTDLLISDFAPIVDFDQIGLEFEMPSFEAPAGLAPDPTPEQGTPTGSPTPQGDESDRSDSGGLQGKNPPTRQPSLRRFKREYRDFKLSKMTKQEIFALLVKANRRRKSAERKAYKLRDKIRRINDDAMTAVGSRQRTIEEQWEVMRELQRRGLVSTEDLEKVLWDVMKIKRPINEHEFH